MSHVNAEWISIVLSDCICWWSEEAVSSSIEIHYNMTEVIVWDYLLAFRYQVSFMPVTLCKFNNRSTQEYVCIDVSYILCVSKLHLEMSVFPIVKEKATPVHTWSYMGRVEVQLQWFLNLLLFRDEWSASFPSACTLMQDPPQYPLNRKLGGPQS